jgi:8-amino-7-oxononanoate synthase
MNHLENELTRKLDTRQQNGSLRKLKETNPSLVDFTSNDYLGLAQNEELFRMIHERMALAPYRNGAAGSRLLSGNSVLAEKVENKLASLFKAEAALLFNSGYTANMGVLSSLPQKDDTILYDELAHACIKDGARLSLARRYSFRHNDLNDLESKIKRSTGKIFIAVESIYSMDGDQCPLVDLVTLAEKYDANIIVDEAHSTGVIGENGNGLTVSLGLQDKITVRIYTFGKAMGVHGACVVGSEKLIQYFVNFARPFIYTTALPPHSIVSIDCAFDYLKQHGELQQKLRENIRLYLNETVILKNRTNSESAIQTVLVPGNEQAKSTALQLQEKGFDVRPILAPTVPAESERLRICLHTFNTMDEVRNLSTAIKLLTTLNGNT